jgi:DNA-binding NarL/FixJ family response regulator
VDPVYWRSRLYRNVFTYQGRRVAVRSWSVKIQVHGKRKAFTLQSRNRVEAANEACRIYQTVMGHGWEAVSFRGKARLQGLLPTLPPSVAFVSDDIEHWRRRLIHRKYPEPDPAQPEREFSVRIEHDRTSHYFPLGTSDENEAATRAVLIFKTVVNKGWERAKASFPRELSLGLRWQDDPLAWTYTTFYTQHSNGPAKPKNAHLRERSVVFIEADAGIRRALAAAANRQEGFRCDATFASAADALREIPRQHVDLALANHDLPEETAAACFEELHRVRPDLVVLSYSVFGDADELFKSTPGGSVVYMLKRTSPWKLFDPIAQMTETPTHEAIASHVRRYFQELSALLPSGPPFWKTAKLTPREQEILAHLSKGNLLKEIAALLGISSWTVQGHVKSIFEKLNVHNRTEAVVKYLQR